MCSEIDQFPSFPRRMSDSRQIFPVHDNEEIVIVSEALDSIPESERTETAAVERESENLEDGGDRRKQPEEIENDDEEKEEDSNKATASHREINDDGDGDGFKTPTSSSHRIPEITDCPPPPVKPRPPPSKLKRKASPPQDATAEVESIFRPFPNDKDEPQQHNIKKSRTDGEDRS